MGVSYLFVFTHEIPISFRGPRPTYKIVKFHFVNTNRYDTACSKCSQLEHPFFKAGTITVINFLVIKPVEGCGSRPVGPTYDLFH